MGRIMDQGPSVIIIEDTNGAVFGGFAANSWTISPKFVGNDGAFLFTLRPKMRCFSSSGYNDHYQYLNLHQQTMPNGLVRIDRFTIYSLPRFFGVMLNLLFFMLNREWAVNSITGDYGWTPNMVRANARKRVQHSRTTHSYQLTKISKLEISKCGQWAKSPNQTM